MHDNSPAASPVAIDAKSQESHQDAGKAVFLLEQAGYHAVALRNGGYVVIDLADMSTAAECQDLGELMSFAQERAEEVVGPEQGE
jgi:hypothetical protein